MKDTTVLARCNLYAVLGAIPHLLRLDPIAAELVRDKHIKIGFSVKNGPKGTLILNDGTAEMVKGTEGCDIKLWFPSAEKFNALIDGKGTPIPVSGFQHIGFLLKGFTKLTDRLSAYLRPDPEMLKDPVFFKTSTTLMLYDRLFNIENTADVPEGKTYLDFLNPDSLMKIEGAMVEPSLETAEGGERFQFVRFGYFCKDTKNENTYNQVVSLKDNAKK